MLCVVVGVCWAVVVGCCFTFVRCWFCILFILMSSAEGGCARGVRKFVVLLDGRGGAVRAWPLLTAEEVLELRLRREEEELMQRQKMEE